MKEIWRHTSTSGSQPPRGRVPFVLWTCPACPADVLSNLCGIAQTWGRYVPTSQGLAPKLSLAHFRGIPTTEFLSVFFVYRFSSPKKSHDSQRRDRISRKFFCCGRGAKIRHRTCATKKSRDKDLPELWGKLPGAICLNTLCFSG